MQFAKSEDYNKIRCILLKNT